MLCFIPCFKDLVLELEGLEEKSLGNQPCLQVYELTYSLKAKPVKSNTDHTITSSGREKGVTKSFNF